MKARTRLQEMKYLQALGYAWGRKDAPHPPILDLVTGSSEFAAFYSIREEMTGTHITIQDAWEYFSHLHMSEQKQYMTGEWVRMAYSPYDERQEITHG